MSTTQTLKFGLDALLREVRQLALDKLGEGRAVALGSDKLDKIAARLTEMESRLRIALMQAKSIDNLAGVRQRSLHDLPRDRRFQEQQSIQAQVGSAADLRSTALRLAGAIQALYADLIQPTRADIVEKVPELLTQLGGSFDHATLQKMLEQPSEPQWMAHAPPTVSAADALTMALALTSFLIQRLKKRQQRN